MLKSPSWSLTVRLCFWLAGTICIFIWLEARAEGGMRGRYLPLTPWSPPRPNLGRPVRGPYMPWDHIGLEGKRLQLQPRSPLGERSCLGEPPSKTKLEDWRLRVIQIDTSPEGGGDTGTLTLRCVTTWPGVWTPLDPHCTVPYQGFLIFWTNIF